MEGWVYTRPVKRKIEDALFCIPFNRYFST